MKKYAIGLVIALIAVSTASTALAKNGDHGERGEKNGHAIERIGKWLKDKGEKRDEGRKSNACLSDAKAAYETALKSAMQTLQTAKKTAHQTRVDAITAAHGDQSAIDAAWAAYQSAWLAAWRTYSNAVFAAMSTYGTARSACPLATTNPTPTPVPSAAKAITSFNFTTPAATGAINEPAHTVTIFVPVGTNVTALVPTIGITGISVSSASGIAKDFTNPVTYIVTAANGTKQSYVVTVNFGYTGAMVAAHNTAADCWSIVNGKVYNLTSYASMTSTHPGGAGAIGAMCGHDASSAFNTKHGTAPNPNAMLNSFLLGNLIQ